MRLLLIAIAITTTFLYCRKDNKEEVDFDALIQCADEQYTDSTLLAGRLAGTWQLFNRVCPGGTEKMDEVQVTFTSGRMYEIVKNGTLLSQGAWHFNQWGSAYGIVTSPFQFYLSGSISFCNKNMVFTALPVDGCNHYYRRIR
jgi:hypothetical protein